MAKQKTEAAQENVEEKAPKKSNHTLATKITFIIAFLCMVASLLLPWPDMTFKGKVSFNNSLVMQLPAAIESLINGVTGKAINIKFGAESCLFSFAVDFMGLLPGEKYFDIGALFILLYAVSVVVSLFILISVLAGKNGPKTLGRASFAEIFAMVSLLPLLCMCLQRISLLGYGMFKWNPGFVVGVGGVFLMMVVQAFIYKKSSGVMKFILALFSMIAALYCVYSVTAIIPKLEKPLTDLNGKLNGKLFAGVWFSVDGDLNPLPYIDLALIFSSNYFTDFLKGKQVTDMVIAICACLGGLLVLFNAILDILGIAKKTKKGMLRFNIFRFVLELLCVAVVIVMVPTVLKGKIGIPLIAVVAICFLQMILNIARLAAFKKKQRKAQEEAQRARRQQQMARLQNGRRGGAADPALAASLEQEEAERKQRREEREAKRAQREAERDARLKAVTGKQEDNVENVYTVSQIYKGPTDEFIDTLSNNEKIEFARKFIEDRKGALKQLPEYVIEGNNDKFFSSIFIYYGSICSQISSGLMGKFYDRLYKEKNA